MTSGIPSEGPSDRPNKSPNREQNRLASDTTNYANEDAMMAAMIDSQSKADTSDLARSKQNKPIGDVAIDVNAFSYRYPKAGVDVLNIPRWKVAVGERIFLQGASGSGKSTLLQVLCGLKVGRGSLSITGTEMAGLSQGKRDRFRARHIGMVFQQFNLIPYLSMRDNVLLAANLAGNHSGSKERAEFLLDKVGLSQTEWHRTAETLSIGQQQRVAIARSLINSPEILLLDAPTSALDDTNQELFMSALLGHLDVNPTTTVIFVSHDIRLASYFEKTLSLYDIFSNASLKKKQIQESTEKKGDANDR